MGFQMSESEVAAHQAKVRAGRNGASEAKPVQEKPKRAGRVKAAKVVDIVGSGELKIIVPIPPSINECYTNMKGSGGRRRVLTDEARQYKEDVKTQAILEAPSQGFVYIPKQRVTLALDFYFADYRRDLSNHIKLLEDSLASALGFNDRAIDDLAVRRRCIDPARPRCEAKVSIIGGSK